MKRTKILAGTLGVAAVLVAQSAFGAGFGIYEGSARGNAMGTEVTADPASASVLYNNAAGMTELPGTQMEMGTTLINPRQTVKTTTPAGTVDNDAKSKWFTPPNAYVTHQFNDKVWAGLGIFSRYGLGVEYENGWLGRYNCQEANIQSIDINPSVAYKVLDNLSLAAGFRAQWFDIELVRALPTGAPFMSPDVKFTMSGDSWGIGYNLGAFYKATEWLSFGLAFDSEIKQSVDGEYDVQTPRGSLGGDAGGDLTTPAILRFGASVKATEKLTLNAGIVYTMWSSYEELAIEFDPAMMGHKESVTPKDWDNAFRYQFGAEYALTPAWALRAGYIFDETPESDSHVDYVIPSNDRHLFSLGVGYKTGDFSCDLGYTYLLMVDRDVPARPAEGVLPSKFDGGHAHMIGISFGYKL